MNNTHSSRARSMVLPLVLTALFAALTAIGAFLRILAGEISFTLQVFFTSMAGILLFLLLFRRQCAGKGKQQ